MKKIALAFLMLVSAGALFAQSKDLTALALVKLNKSESVTVKQLKVRCENYEKQSGHKLTVAEREQYLDILINEKLMLQAAAKAGISVPDSSVNQYFLQMMSQQLGSVAVLTEKEISDYVMKASGVSLDQLLVQQTGMNVAESKAFVKNSLIIQQYVISQRQAELQKVSPTDEQIRQFYESNKASFVWTDMMKMFMLVVPKGSNSDAAAQKCNELRNKIADKKITIEQLEVQAKAEGAGFQAQTGLIQKTEPWALNIGMSYKNLLFVFDQPVGYLSEVNETPNDFRVISVVKKYDAKMLGLSDVLQPETTMTVYEAIRNNLAQQLQMAYIQNAANEISQSLNTPENVDRKKTGDDLKKLLDWGN